MAKIEPGMLCLVKSGENTGRECTVVRRVSKGDYIAELDGHPDEDCWLVHGPRIEAMIMHKVRYWNGYAGQLSSELLPIGNRSSNKVEESRRLAIV